MFTSLIDFKYWINSPKLLSETDDKLIYSYIPKGVKQIGDKLELYHGTSLLRAKKIKNQGLKLFAVKNQTMSGDPIDNRNYVWLAKQFSTAKLYAEMHRHPAVIVFHIPLRFFQEKTFFPERQKFSDGPVSVWIRKEVPAEYIHSIIKV